MIDFSNPFVDINSGIEKHIAIAAHVRTVEAPSIWSEKRFSLPKEGYGEYGKFTFVGREWQREILDAFLRYHFVITIGPVQVGKSVAGIDVPWAWFQDQIGGRALLVYADKETVKDVFEEKLKPIIEQNLTHLYSGRENDLRQDKIILRSGISRCASCNVKNDIATFPAKFVLCDEVAKWRAKTKSSFDAVGQAIGRTRDYHGAPGIDYRVAIVSSPVEVGDPLYVQTYQPGTLILKRKVPCPQCGGYIEFRVEDIHEIPPPGKEKDHDPHRIRAEKAARYICPLCEKEIKDSDRYDMDLNGAWITDEETIEGGKIANPDPLRETADRVCFWMPGRLISMPEKYPFYECLAGYFQAKFNPDHNAWRNFWNEDLARFYVPQAQRLTEAYLKSRSKTAYTTTSVIPEGVLVAVGGIDTQDNGFFYVIVGYGRYMETWILRFGFIPCDIGTSEFKDPEKVRARFADVYYMHPLIDKDKKTLPCILALMDEGGHREKQVRYICLKHHEIVPYKGAGKDSPLFRKSENKHLYLCNTESLSKLVEKDMGSDTWHLPEDVTQEFIDQIQRQYTKEDIDKNGNVKYEWVHGGEDHFRDCLNMAMAGAYILDLPGRLNNEQGIKQVLNTVASQSNRLVPQTESREIPHAQTAAPQMRRQSRYNMRGASPFHTRNRIGRWR